MAWYLWVIGAVFLLMVIIKIVTKPTEDGFVSQTTSFFRNACKKALTGC